MTGEVHHSVPHQLPHGEWVIRCVVCKLVGTGAPMGTREEAVAAARNHAQTFRDFAGRSFADRFADPY